MKKNKGFVVSTILYSILIAFLIILGVTLYIFSSATTTIGSATDDLVNANDLSVRQIIFKNNEESERRNDILAVITSKYGDYYWPRDFNMTINKTGILEKGSESIPIEISYYCDKDYTVEMTKEEKIENDIKSNSYTCIDPNIRIFYLEVSDGNKTVYSFVANPYNN